MSVLTVNALTGGSVKLSEDALAGLRGELRGPLCLPGEPGYDTARTIWNAMIDRRPALIIRAMEAADVTRGVRFASRHGLPVAVRGGGHNIAGKAVCDGGLMIDLSLMKSVRVDAAARRVHVEPGATLGDLDRETQLAGLAVPVGINSTTGVAGLTLGGGFGWLQRKYGLTLDNLVSAEVVTAGGESLRASATENPDLFWAIRGGGGNFGVVTSFEFQAHPVGPVLSGLIVHPFANAGELLRGYRQVAAQAPDELTCWVVMRKAPPLPFLPPEVHGTEVVVLAVCWCGDVAAGEKAIAPLRALGKPHAEVIGPNPLAGWQTAFDPLLTPGARNYWKSHDFRELSDGLIDELVAAVKQLPTPECEVFIAQLGGAINRVPVGATAYPHRDVEFVMNVHTRWTDPSQDKTCIAWARGLFDRTAPFATGGVYVNFMPEDEDQRVPQGAYGANFERLAKLKTRFDPTNVFRQNMNIRPGR
ncbi:MAG: FAD-binding oxidoreductase [Candidatus Eisenbacteria bacterium]